MITSVLLYIAEGLAFGQDIFLEVENIYSQLRLGLLAIEGMFESYVSLNRITAIIIESCLFFMTIFTADNWEDFPCVCKNTQIV